MAAPQRARHPAFDRLSLLSWVRRTTNRYIVWNPADLFVKADASRNRPAEVAVYYERRHIFYLFSRSWKHMLVAFGSLTLLLVTDRGLAQVALGLFTFYAQSRLLWDLVEWSITRIIITDRRLLEFGGFLRRRGATLPLGKLTDLNFEQSFVGLLFNYGMVRVESAGQDQALSRIDFLRDPVTFQQELIAKAIRPAAP